MYILVIIGTVLVVLVFLTVIILQSKERKRKLGFKDRISLENIVETKPSTKIHHDDPYSNSDIEETDVEWNMPREYNVEQNVAETGNKYLNTGITLIKNQKYRDAVLCLNKAVDMDKTDAHTYYYRGMAKLKLNLFNDAIEDLTDAILRKLNKPDAFYSRGQSFLKVDDKESALRDFNQYIMLDKSNPEAYYLRGTINYDKKDFKSSIDDFSNAIILNPNHESAYFKRGLAKQKTGDMRGCCSDLQCALDKGYLEAYHYLQEYCNN